MASEALIKRIIELRSDDIKTDPAVEILLDEFPEVTRGIVCKVWWEYNEKGMYQRLVSDSAPDNVIQIPQSQVVTRPENEQTDTRAWEQQRDRLLASTSFVRVMHMNDLHLPYHDERALELFLQLALRFQPHVIVVGSDAFDYPTISRYEKDHDINVADWLVETEQYWYPIIDALRSVVPKAQLPFIFGNHDRRALLAIKNNDARVVLMREYKRIIGYRDVLWLGKTEVLNIGNLIVAHGKRFNMYASAYTAKDFNFKPVNVGHTHRPQQMLGCVVNGMLCQKVPAYEDNGYPSDWQHGTTLITIDTDSGSVVQVPYVFSEAGHSLWCAYGNEIITSKVLNYDRMAA